MIPESCWQPRLIWGVACLTELYRNRRKRDARIGSYVEPYPPHE